MRHYQALRDYTDYSDIVATTPSRGYCGNLHIGYSIMCPNCAWHHCRLRVVQNLSLPNSCLFTRKCPPERLINSSTFLVHCTTTPPQYLAIKSCIQLSTQLSSDVPWDSFSVSYNGERPANRRPQPPWMDQKYKVWFQDPLKVMENQIGNPDFNSHIDYAPKRVFRKNKCRYCDLMSGNWGWEQVVCMPNFCRQFVSQVNTRIRSERMSRCMGRCLLLSFLVVIRRRYLLRQDTPSFIHCMSHWGLYTTQ